MLSIKCLRPVTCLQVLKTAYYACFHSVMNYGIMYWGTSSASIAIFRLQKRAIRFLNGAQGLAHCRDLFKNSNVLTLYAQFALVTAMFVFDNKHKFVRNSEYNSHHTRYGNNISIPRHTTTQYEKGPYYQCVKVFNSLPDRIKTEASRNKYKSMVTSYLLNKCPYSLQELY